MKDLPVLLQNMNQNKQNQIKITFIQSPINQVLDNLDSALNQHALSEDSRNFAMISKRLSENIRRIEQNEIKTNSNKRFNNFKQIKNSIISKDAETIKLEIQQRLNSIRDKSCKFKSQKELPDSKQKQEDGKKDMVARKLFQEHRNKLEQPNTVKSQNSLLNCLNEIKEVKKMIKNIKERCKNGPIERKQRMQNYYLNSNSAHKRYVSHSGSKYNYTKYHDLSQKKMIDFSSRRQRSEKQFNWIANTVDVKQFTIITSQETTRTSPPFILQ